MSAEAGAGPLRAKTLWRPAVRSRLGTLGVIAVLALVPLVFPAWTSFLIVAGIYFLAVLGLDMFVGQTGQISLGQTLFFAIGAYGGGILTLDHGVPTVAATVIMALVSAVVAYILGRPFLRLRGYYLALATLGLAVITQSTATGLTSLTGGPSGLSGMPNLAIGSYVFESDQANYYIVLALGLLAALLVTGIRRSTAGRALAAIAGDQQAAAMLGVNPATYKTRAFVLAAVFASVAGSLFAFYNRFVSPESVSVVMALNFVIMLAIGGSRTLLGPLLGVLLIQALPQAGQSFARYEPLLAGLVLVVVITYLPDGLWGGIRGCVTRRRR
jgi:branched-chain amino acid transport system permease protein